MPRRAFRLAFRLATAQSNIAASSFASPSYSDDEEDAVSEDSDSTRRGDAIGDTPGVVQPRQEAGLAVVREAAPLAFRFLVAGTPFVRTFNISTKGRVLGLQDVDELPHGI